MQTDNIYKEPLKVVCISTRGSKKLIKGGIYLANRLYKTEVYLSGVGRYPVENFTLLNGGLLSKEPSFSVEHKKSVNPSQTNYTGQFIQCRFSTGKLKEGEIYFVEDQRKIERKGYQGSINYIYKLKIRGFRNCMSSYRFNEISTIEQRSIKLKNLNGDKIKTGEQERKFLLYSDKERISILFQLLTKILIDMNNVQFNSKEIDITKLMLLKGKDYNLIEEDVKIFLKSKVEALIKKYINHL